MIGDIEQAMIAMNHQGLRAGAIPSPKKACSVQRVLPSLWRTKVVEVGHRKERRAFLRRSRAPAVVHLLPYASGRGGAGV